MFAWPTGLVFATAWWMFVTGGGFGDCVTVAATPNQVLACPSRPMSLFSWTVFAALAISPGVMATRHWWKFRRRAA